MKKHTLLYMTLSLLVAAGGVTTVWAAMESMEHPQAPAMTLTQVHKSILPMSLKSLDVIGQAVASGDTLVAQRELAHLKAMLTQIQTVVAQEVGPAFANTTCPIMGSPIDPDKVTADLVREYKDQKVAFCCGACPAQWDKLSDAEKTAKLKAHQAPTAVNGHESHPH